MHVLSTPPAFILSQDQTLHKKMFQKETGREKPKPNQKQTNQHKVLDWQNPKITKVQTTNPQPDGAQRRLVKKYVKHVQPHPTHTMNQTDDAIHHWNSTTPPPAHTHKKAHTTQCTKKRQANTPTQQKYIGTLSSSQTTPAHPTTRTKNDPSRKKRLRQKLHNQPTKSQTHVKPRLTRT